MIEIKGAQIEKGLKFKIKGKRKIYTASDVFFDHLEITIYYRDTGALWKRLKIGRNTNLIVYEPGDKI